MSKSIRKHLGCVSKELARKDFDVVSQLQCTVFGVVRHDNTHNNTTGELRTLEPLKQLRKLCINRIINGLLQAVGLP